MWFYLIIAFAAFSNNPALAIVSHKETPIQAQVLRGNPVADERPSIQQQREEGYRKLQSNYCITGYIMDTFCIGLQTLLDKPNLISLQYPDQHSVHCLTEISSCIKSGYEVLGPPPSNSVNYTREVKLDSNGNTLVFNLARLTGICSSCSGSGTISQGFRATVTGMLTGSGDPPTLAVDQVMPASVSCSSLLATAPTAHVATPTVRPTARPTARPAGRPTLKPIATPLLPTNKPLSSSTKPSVVVPAIVMPSSPPSTGIKVPAGYCFSSINTVHVQSKGTVAMKDLKIGDLVEDVAGNMVRVYSFGHYESTAKAHYLQIHATGLERPLEISRDHLVFLAAMSQPIPSSLIRVGDKLRLEKDRAAEVTKVKEVEREGVYAPFTTSGTILVSGVASSNYVTLQIESPVLLLGKYTTNLSMHWLAHVFQAPHRFVCEWNMEFCDREIYNQDGMSTWIHMPLIASQWLLKQNEMIMVSVFIPTFLVGASFYAVEMACVHKFWLLLAFLLVRIIGASLSSRNKCKSA